jgi:hypothetical protein
MAQWLPQSGPPRLDQQWSAWIVIVAMLFLGAVFAFYYFVR